MVKDIYQYRSDILASELQFAVDCLHTTPLDKNEVLSPANLSLALTLVQQGTKGETRKKINKVLLMGTCDNHVTVNQRFVQQTLQKAENGVVLEIANKLFISDRIHIKEEYKNGLKKNFDAETKTMNFNKATECVKIMNDFIRNATKGKIDPQIDEACLYGSSAVLISALYAKALWSKPFEVHNTKIEKFTKGDGKTENILFMCQFDCHGYYANNEVQVLSKTHKDPAFQFVWILPKDPTAKGFEEFRTKLTGKKIQEYLNMMKYKEVSVTVPKMNMKCGYDLTNILTKLGLSGLATTDADFSGMTDSQFMVRNGTHSTLLEVDEVGTVAVAVTMCGVGDSKFGAPQPPSFHATHPFIFLMHKNQHPIMIGQFNGPEE